MTPDNQRKRLLISIFLLGFVLFNYPILSLFNLSLIISGMPLLYLYLFFVWALIIALMAIAIM
ncbi:conserved hypothetical protein [Candidatus Desulfarcum epimagneticum]|uniref:Uncharacterized protein n=1 Tax=uncultured Desulfobacteraceae bacterium TaxID=218296 RepID=A0A484HNE7_9BACT|nr:conserved hypothetical protein [uncultured Desulfobacteraceae bacterium]